MIYNISIIIKISSKWQNSLKKFFTISFVKGCSKQFSILSKKFNLQLAYIILKKLNIYITIAKNRLDNTSKCDVVFIRSVVGIARLYISVRQKDNSKLESKNI